ncbi:MAG: 4-hydroxy-4-methyl-2-oxoglutarate aldolase [Alphaproteobacteria bacterium]|jgi:4-hydroxy-4-methyl-2-oxoglutarate aldolase
MDDIVEGFKKLASASISDALDRLGIHGMVQGLAPLTNGHHVVGRAFTLKYIPCGVVKGTVGDYIDDVPPGGVVVLDNAGRLDCTVWGDILTTVANARGVAGTVIHGVCRDVAGSLDVGYPIFSRGRFMRTGKDRVQVDGTNVPVSLGDVQVRPGDIVIGTDDGVLVVPVESEAEVLAIATGVSEAEERIIADVKSGAKLVDARKKHGYHQLQTKR